MVEKVRVGYKFVTHIKLKRRRDDPDTSFPAVANFMHADMVNTQ